MPLVGSSALAQSWDDFHFQRAFGEVGLRLELWDEKRSSTNTTLAQREILAREELTVGTLGYFYHPRFVEFDLRGTIGVEEQWTFIEGPQGDRSNQTIFPNWNLRTRLFKENAYSGEIYSTRAETWTRQSFFPTTRSTVTETGANVHANDWTLPSRLHYHRYTFDSHGVSSQDQVRDNVLARGSRLGDKAQLQYGLEYNRTRQTKTALEYEDYSGNASSTQFFGADNELRWLNHVSSRVQKGDIEVESLGGSSQVFNRWGERLIGNAGAQYNRTDSGEAFSETMGLSVGVGHQLYESLSSGLSLQGSTTRVAGGSIDTNGGGGQLNYRKNTPIGKLALSYEIDYYVQDQDDIGGTVPVFDEAHQFTLGTPIILTNHAVEGISVVVTDVTGLTIYSEGPDYVLTAQGTQTRIDIPVGSLISPGDTILVDYIFSPNPEIEFADLSQVSSIRYNFNELADVSVTYATADQTLLSGTNTGILSNSRRTGAALNLYPFGATLGARYEDFDSPFAPFERITLLADYQHKMWKGAFGHLGAETFTTEFDGQAENERGTSATFTFNSRLDGSSVLEFWSQWHEIKYRTDEGTGFGLELSWKRRFRALALSISLRHMDEEFAIASDQRVTSLIFTISRTF